MAYRLLLLLLFIPLGASPPVLSQALAEETVQFELDDQPWAVGFRRVSSTSALTEWVIPPETVHNWAVLFSTQRLFGMSSRGFTPQKMMLEMKARLEERVPGLVWNVLAEDTSSILYEWKVPPGGEIPPQHEIARLFAGAVDIHRIAYVEKVAEIATERRTSWIGRMKAATLVEQ